MASLKYASFIQKAILPDQRYLENILSDYFLLFKPREIVSGDFYYCSRKEELIVVAAGDCTGSWSSRCTDEHHGGLLSE